ncbi:hypothetical protein H1W37_19500 [Stappia taiwanensis]|uniref:Uncharacterized protein n=1 Tax=Stappia taiwanensis TaxID=992267 RepID=A0A838XRG9_9HYPH|nr:hypothetical protein [Stappia taiwanensis]MBA4613849.1 hypothetical protein [Stappia taiwanensis]GGE79041.1 hypothetical protein GCM10007285_03590 [Stappia taiwanensis]
MDFFVTLFGAFLGGGAVTGVFQWMAKRREHNIKMVEIGLAILREPPRKDGISAARDWGIKLVEKYSGVPFSKKAKEELLRHSLDIKRSLWKGQFATKDDAMLKIIDHLITDRPNTKKYDDLLRENNLRKRAGDAEKD